jgi:uncharacterized protein YjbI with pentapeptide repeats
MIHASIYLNGTPRGGVSSLVTALRDAGTSSVGAVECARVPIEDAIESGWLEWATHLDVTDDALDFTARVACNECYGLNATWRSDDHTRVTALVERIAAIADIDFAVEIRGTVDPTSKNPEEYRRAVLARCPPEVYARQGCVGCGDQTWIGARVIALLSDPRRVSQESPLVVQTNMRDAVAATFANDGVFARIEARGPRLLAMRGNRWQAPTSIAPAKRPTLAAQKTLAELVATDGDEQAVDVEASDLVAPFAGLYRIQATRLEAEGAVLAFAHLDDSQLDDSGLVGADLRGACARGSRWVEVSLAEADLRWADFSGAELPLVRLDNANCTGASFRDVKFEKPSFDGAKLQGAIFDGADLTNARILNADLTGASFKGAKIDGIVLTGSVLTGTGLKGA